jgi:hydrogenase-4 component E
MTTHLRSAAELVLLLIVLIDFTILGTSRLSACIRAIAVQGALLGLLPVLLDDPRSIHAVALAIGTIVVKAYVLPRLLRWAIREASIRREVEPLIGYMASLLLGATALGVAFAVSARLPLGDHSGLLVPAALVTVMIGLIVLITRGKAVSQVVGYLMLENGIYLFGLTQARRVPFLVEVGVLLDVFVGVFIMGIVVFHINREFDSISSTKLTELRDT